MAEEKYGRHIIKEIFRLLILFIIGAFVYMGIEIAFRGYTHWTMGIVGGLCFVIIGGLNNYYDWQMPFWKQCLVGALVVTSLEFVAGVVLNLELGLSIWDYSNMFGNVLGQICLPFSIAWYGLSGVAIIFDDFLRWWLFGEPFPHYVWFKGKN